MSFDDPGTERRLSLVIGGHVDHGKSTIIGRLLADTGSLPEGKLEQVRAQCERTSKPFEYAFLLDALKDEQAQGITIDAARVFFRTVKRPYVIIDAPGHIEFLRNLVTGAARAEAALLVIDAKEGVRENSRRHGYMMAMLGIRQLVVLVNKMDLVGWQRGVFERIIEEYREFLGRLDVRPGGFIPVSGREGDNVARRSEHAPWYTGPTVLETLDAFVPEAPDLDKPFRMPVQDVYKFTQRGDERRIVAGTIDSGRVSAGDEVVFHPSGKRGRVKSIEGFNKPTATTADAGEATGFTLTEQLYVARGELAAIAGQPAPHVGTRLRASVFWLGKEPLILHKDYLLKLGTARVPVRVEAIHRVLDAATLEANEHKARVDRHEVAECTLRASRPIAFDLASELATTSRFVIVDDFEIRGGGIAREALAGSERSAREKQHLRSLDWEASDIPAEKRAERYRQRATLVIVAGDQSRRLASELEQRLLDIGNLVYHLGLGDAGQLARASEAASLMLDAGVILILSVSELDPGQLETLQGAIDQDRVELIRVGENAIDADAPDAVDSVKRLLEEKGIIFRPW